MTATTASSTSIGIITASQKKLCKSPYFDDSKDSDSGSSDSDTESYESYEGKGMRLFEVAGLQAALQSVCCKECGGGPVVLREDFSKWQGLCTQPHLFCESCSCVAPSVGTSKVVEVNRKAVFAKQVFGRYLFESSNALRHARLATTTVKECVCQKEEERFGRQTSEEGVMYARGAFDAPSDDAPGPSKRAKRK